MYLMGKFVRLIPYPLDFVGNVRNFTQYFLLVGNYGTYRLFQLFLSIQRLAGK